MYYKPSPLFEDISITQIYTIHYFEYYKDYQFKGESHDFWEILYVDKGEVLVTAGSRHLIMRAGQLIFHKPGEFHSVAANGVIAPNTVVFSFDCTSTAMSYFEDKILYADDEIKDLIARIIAETKAVYENDLNDPLYRELELRKEYPFGGCQVIKLYLELMLIEFIRKGILAEQYKSLTTIERNFSSKNAYTDIVNYIENNLTKRLSISDICKISTVNRSSLERIFKKHSGMSIIQFCRYKKVDKAKLLIRQGKLNLTQISDLLGFDSLHYFSRTFKQITGMTPSEYAVSTKAMVDHSLEVSKKNSDL